MCLCDVIQRAKVVNAYNGFSRNVVYVVKASIGWLLTNVIDQPVALAVRIVFLAQRACLGRDASGGSTDVVLTIAIIEVVSLIQSDFEPARYVDSQ